MGTPKIVLDTNILISAFGWEGKPRRILNACIDGQLELVISSKQLDELHRVLQYPKFGFASRQRERVSAVILQVATVIEIKGTLRIVKEDPSDNIILETALEGKAAFLITGDERILKLKEYEGVKILNAHEFLLVGVF